MLICDVIYERDIHGVTMINLLKYSNYIYGKLLKNVLTVVRFLQIRS